MGMWSLTRRRLLEMPGVLCVSSVRMEDLTPAMSASAVVVEPRLSPITAGLLHDALTRSSDLCEMALEEAIQASNGLLMEFIALATTGKRLRDVLAQQVHALGVDTLRRSALRLICGAHILGSAVAADSLPGALGETLEKVSVAMHQLRGEHLIVAEGEFWVGLHDLRSRALFDLLNENPPPSMGESFSHCLRCIPLSFRGEAARRGAVYVAQSLKSRLDRSDGQRNVALTSNALHPMARWIAAELVESDSSLTGDSAAQYVASLLEAAESVGHHCVYLRNYSDSGEFQASFDRPRIDRDVVEAIGRGSTSTGCCRYTS